MSLNGYMIEVTGLSPRATERDVYDFFSFSGAIEHVEIIRSGDYGSTAYVTFKDPHALDTAVLLSGATIVDERVCIVRWGQNEEESDFWNRPSWNLEDDADTTVQPLVGLWSDRCRSPIGRGRPFIFVGCLLICIAVTVIGFSSDIGYRLGDTKEDCSVYTGPRWAAAIIFVIGFWILDFSNNAVQGPARALMADISGEHGCSAANAIFCSWMAVGNILGYSSGASGAWHKWFPFLQTKACCEACANLKGAFLVAVVFLLCCMSVTMILAKEVPLSKLEISAQVKTGFFDAFKSFKSLPAGMYSVLLVTALTWLAWFPFILFDTDWMGREVYRGDAKGTPAQVSAFDRGVREGAFGLLLNSIVLVLSSFLIEPLSRKLTPKVVWAIGQFCYFIAMVAMVVLSMISMKGYNSKIQLPAGAEENIRITALVIFAALGFPLAVLYSVPFGVASTIAAKEGGGQGLCIGVLNVSIVLPQMIIALGAGPWDAIFGKGNVPAFGLAGVFSLIAATLALILLPKLSGKDLKLQNLGSMH